MIKKILLYSCVFTVCLYAYRVFLYAGLRKNKEGVFAKYTEILEGQTTYDAVFLGSSRAEMHYHPGIFDSITRLHSYNIGRSGASVKICLSLLKIYCKQHHNPRYVIYNIDAYTLKHDSDTLYSFAMYFPYLGNDYLRKELQTIDSRFNSFYYNAFHSLPYSQIDYLSASLHGWLNKPGKYDTLCYKGYQTSEINAPLFRTAQVPHYSYIHPHNRAYIDSIIQFCKKQHLQLLLVSSPVYQKGNQEIINKAQVSAQLRNIASINKIDFWDYSDGALSLDSNLYTDYHHLNRTGASLFSRQFSKDFNNKFPH